MVSVLLKYYESKVNSECILYVYSKETENYEVGYIPESAPTNPNPGILYLD